MSPPTYRRDDAGRRLQGIAAEVTTEGTPGRGSAMRLDRQGGDRSYDEDRIKLAGFFVGSAVYGIDIMRIKEVIQARAQAVRPVPGAPPIIAGVISLRGAVIPVVDLRRRFGVAIDESIERFNKLVIVSVRGRIVGLMVDRVLGELRVAPDAVRPAPSMLRESPGDPSQDFFAGVCRVGGEIVFLLHLEALIDPRNPGGSPT